MTLWICLGIGCAVMVASILVTVLWDLEILALLTAIVGGVAVLIFGVLLFAQWHDRVACETFSREAARETRFVHYTAFSWDCLTPTQDGKWISTSRLRDID